VLASVPLAEIVAVAPKPLPEVRETSKPGGGVTVREPVRFVPLTVKLCCAEAEG
jgi:hypothetical protein